MNTKSTKRPDCKMSLVEGACDPNVCGKILEIAEAVWPQDLPSEPETAAARTDFLRAINNCRNTVGILCLLDPDFHSKTLGTDDISPEEAAARA